MPRRRSNKAPIRQPYWKQEGQKWYADQEALAKAVSDSGITQSELMAKMGLVLTASKWPDLVVGASIAALFLGSSVSVISESWKLLKIRPA